MNIAWGTLHAGLQSVLDTALDAVVVMDVRDRIIGWNKHAETIFGWREDEVLGKNLSDTIVPADLRDSHRHGLTNYLATGDGPVLNRRIEVAALRRDGEQVAVELSITSSDQFGELLFVGFLRDISQRKDEADRLQRQLRESDHRVKNMLTVVAAIAQQTARSSATLDDFSASFGGRLDGLAKSHQLLISKEWNEVALTALADQVLGADVAQGRARFGGPELLLQPGQVLGLSMILHELYTNAVKYGALCGDAGSIALDWQETDGQVEMRWAEDGPPCTSDAPSSGFGQRMIAMVVRSDLKGEIERDFSGRGLTATLRFPLTS